MDLDRPREKARSVESNKKYFKSFNLINFIYWSMRRILKLFTPIFKPTVVINLLKIIPGMSYALIYFNLMHNIIMHTIISNRSLHTKIFKVFILILSSIILSLTFLFSSKLVNIAGSTVNILNKLWDCATIIASKLFGKLKNCHDLNILNKANLKLAESAHKIFIHTGFIVGAALMLNPATSLAGAIVLIAVTGYAVIDRLKINPLRWLANQLFNSPFEIPKPNNADKKKQYINSTLKLQSGLKTKRIVKTSFKLTTAPISKQGQSAVYKNDRFFSPDPQYGTKNPVRAEPFETLARQAPQGERA